MNDLDNFKRWQENQKRQYDCLMLQEPTLLSIITDNDWLDKSHWPVTKLTNELKDLFYVNRNKKALEFLNKSNSISYNEWSKGIWFWKIFPEPTIAFDKVSVKPLSEPIGVLTYLDYKY